MGKGIELLRRKREALVSELFKLARPAADARAQIAAATRRAYPALLGALAAHGLAGVRAFAWPRTTGPATVRAATEFERLADLLLDAAPREMLIRRLGEALSQTSRQVNTLERRVAPDLRRHMTGVRRALEEREREERLRLKDLIRVLPR